MLRTFSHKFQAVWNLARGRGITPEIFDLLYTVRKDPFRYRTSLLEQGKYRDILALLPPVATPRALEVGCSEGVFTKMLASRVDSLTAVDVSPTALARASKLLRGQSHVTFRQLNVAHEEPGGQYDLVVASEVLYYMGSPAQIAAVGQRLVAWTLPGGHVMLCHMRSQVDEAEGFPVPRFVPSHPGAFTVHGIFDGFPELERVAEQSYPLYKVSLYRRRT